MAGVKYLGLDLIWMMFSDFVAKQNWIRNHSSWNKTFASFAVVQSVVQSYRKELSDKVPFQKKSIERFQNGNLKWGKESSKLKCTDSVTWL